ncbi:Rossmann-like and DUF2520 domain-containing protein [Maribacter sp. CXY002]|uniref:Rossmann-like and DUF2520 domain-containing protein n=1 Tax=Maribacter luteocoastalis TaxID=3407671 RepID=UPI003B66E50F
MLIFSQLTAYYSLYFRKMISIVILGTGNVAQNLFEALHKKDEVKVLAVAGRNTDALNYFSNRTEVFTDWTHLPKADVYLMAIKDDVIHEVSEKLTLDGLLVHTSGAVPMDALSKHSHTGVFYPLQSFTSGKILDFKTIPICVEATSEKDLNLLKYVASTISNTVEHIDSNQRKALHVSAVFTNNFTNYLYGIGKQICEEYTIDFSLLKPLMKETVDKLDVLTPEQAQTGPARRGDRKTLHSHLQLLNDKKHREIYKLLSNAIKAHYGKKL